MHGTDHPSATRHQMSSHTGSCFAAFQQQTLRTAAAPSARTEVGIVEHLDGLQMSSTIVHVIYRAACQGASQQKTLP